LALEQARMKGQSEMLIELAKLAEGFRCEDAVDVADTLARFKTALAGIADEGGLGRLSAEIEEFESKVERPAFS
jgi:hypothetical protein